MTLSRRATRWTLGVLCLVGLFCILSVALLNGRVMRASSGRIVSVEQAASLEDVDYIVVLGAGIRADGSPSDMLHDRVVTAVGIVEAGSDVPLLMSADNQHEDYNEVAAMVTLAASLDVSDEALRTDRLGLSTYESIVRAKEIYGAERIVIVTQSYHLHRALYIAEQIGLEAYGVSADIRTYRGQAYRELREIAARCKDALVLQFDEINKAA